MTLFLAFFFPFFLFAAVPVAHALLMAAMAAIVIVDRIPFAVSVQRLYTPTQSFPMLAIPFFILAGSLMMSGKFGDHLVRFAKLMVGRFHGGLGQVSIVGSVMFGGVSGSAVADATALGNALIPLQKKEGYPPAFAAAVMAASATIAVLIPPSIPLILYGLVSETSIVNLFIAGVVPGLLLASGMIFICWASGRLRHFPLVPLEGGFRTFGKDLFYALPALLMPVFVVGTLRFGIATPTEVSVMAVAYALIVARFVYGDLTLKHIFRCMVSTGIITGAVMLIIMGSSLIQFILTLERVPMHMSSWLLGTLEEPWLIILAMNFVMIIVGMFIDLPAAILLLGPIFVGIATSIGMNLVQLGVVMVVNLAIGLYTPPVGTTLFIATTIAGTPIGRTVKELGWFYAVAIIVLMLMSYVPKLTTFFL